LFSALHQVAGHQSDRWSFKRLFVNLAKIVTRPFSSRISPQRKNFVSLSEHRRPSQLNWVSGSIYSSSTAAPHHSYEGDKFYRLNYPTVSQPAQDDSLDGWKPKVNLLPEQQFRSSVSDSADNEKVIDLPKMYYLEKVRPTKPVSLENKPKEYKIPEKNLYLMALEHFRLRCEMLMDPADCMYSSLLNRIKYNYK
jgi:hypothetical protein